MRTIVWNDDTLDEWIKDPQHFIPENTMTFPGMKDARFIGAQRDRVIATYTLLLLPGVEVEDRDSYIAKIEANGGTIISEPGEAHWDSAHRMARLQKLSGPVATTRRRPRRHRHDRWL